MKRCGMWRCTVVLAGAAIVMGAGPVEAQGVSGTGLGAPAPGQFVSSLDLGASWVQFAHAQYGNFRTDAGGAILGNIIDDRTRRAVFAPEGAVGWGIPGGLFGQQAEGFARLAYYRATASETVDTTGQSNLVPFVAPSTPGGLIGLGGFAESVSVDRRLTSYDGSVGIRLHMPVGAGTISPMAEFGYQRLNQHDHFVASPAFDPALFHNTTGELATDYYRLGIGVGAVQPIAATVSVFSILSGSLDFVHSRFEGRTVALIDVLDPVETASTSDSETKLSGRVQFRGGLAFVITPNVILTVAGQAQYIGAMPRVIYPQSSNVSPAGPGFVGPLTARIDTDSQVTYGAAIGATARY